LLGVTIFSCSSIEERAIEINQKNVLDSLYDLPISEKITGTGIENLNLIRGLKGIQLGLHYNEFDYLRLNVPSKRFKMVQADENESGLKRIFSTTNEDGREYGLELVFANNRLGLIKIKDLDSIEITRESSIFNIPEYEDYVEVFGEPRMKNNDDERRYSYLKKVKQVGWNSYLQPGKYSNFSEYAKWVTNEVEFLYKSLYLRYYFDESDTGGQLVYKSKSLEFKTKSIGLRATLDSALKVEALNYEKFVKKIVDGIEGKNLSTKEKFNRAIEKFK